MSLNGYKIISLKGYLDVWDKVSMYTRYMIKTLLMTRGSGLLILLVSLSIYVVSKNYQEVLLHGQSGFSLIETVFLITFYYFFKQIQQKNIKAKLYALLPLFSYYAVYEYNLLQFGSVLKFQDILLVPEFLDVLPIADALGIAFIASLPFLLILSNLRRKWQYGSVIYPATFLFCVILLTTINPLSKRVYGYLYMQAFSHEHVVAAYGPLSAAFIYENKRKGHIQKIEQYADADDSAVSGQRFVLPEDTHLNQHKNIHIIVLESFIDVRNLQNIHLDAAYLKIFDDPIFNRHSTSLAPGFGNGTARSEFEILCGLPSLQLLGSIEFNVFTGEKVIDCLPKILNDNGYITMASHPYKPDYYNRIKAYQTLGFSDINFGDKYSVSYGDLKIDDAPDGWLFDESLYEQNIAMLKPLIDKGQPILNYVLTAYGHYPFQRNEIARPDKIKIENVSEEANRLVNQIYYRIEALKKYVNSLKDIDPDSLIVVVGDHLPPLTTGMLMYKSLGYSSNRENDTVDKYHETQVFVINDQQYMSIPEIEHHDLFQIVLNTLYKGEFCLQNECRYLDKRIQPKQRNQEVVSQQYIQLLKQSL